MQLEELPQATKLSISHKLGIFTSDDPKHPWDTTTGFEGIIIGTFKQRMMWPHYDTRRAGQPIRPMCKSNDAIAGYPQPDFPWDDKRCGLIALAEPRPTVLKCESCMFSKDPRKAKENGLPVCDSTYEVVMIDDNDRIVILKASGAAKNAMTHYRDWFKKNKAAMFMYRTRLELTSVKNNNNRYADLGLTKGVMTDRDLWVTKYLPLFNQWKEESQTPPSATFSGGSKPKLTELNM